jgi:predicted small secreted protein
MKQLMTLVMLVAAFALSACNTVHGIGKDLEAAGESVQKNSK